MVYGLETMMVTKKQLEEMEVAEMKMLRFAVGVMRKDEIRYEYIRGRFNVERLGMKFREGRLRWYGHVMRRDQEYVRKKGYKNGITGKEEKKEPKKKISGCSEERYGES